MFFYLHYILLTSGLSSVVVLLSVFVRKYSDASQGEIGLLLMTLPFLSLLVKPLFCSMADRQRAHRAYLLGSLGAMLAGFSPLAIVPFFPELHQDHPRLTWYLLLFFIYLGNSGLAVAWSLGDSLAVNAAQRTNTPYTYMRLTGTVSWGVYGYIIGQINELPCLPKYVPAFIILLSGIFIEMVLIVFWNKKDFIMSDPLQANPSVQPADLSLDNPQAVHGSTTPGSPKVKPANADHLARQYRIEMDSAPSSLGGTLRIKTGTALVLRDILATEDFQKRLRTLSDNQRHPEIEDNGAGVGSTTVAKLKSQATGRLSLEAQKIDTTNESEIKSDRESGYLEVESDIGDSANIKNNKNPQIIIFRMIFSEDGRLIKYLIVFTLGGFLLAPLNFLFLSFDIRCQKEGCNFSNLAGSVLISQASSETACFFILPWILRWTSRSMATAFAFTILFTRFFFYAQYYYTTDISPYWALIGEWGHGIGYSILATILADVSLMFASQCHLFIPELRQLGYLSGIKGTSKEVIEAEEAEIKMALRATMQALMNGLMDGLGNGLGSMLCGIVIEAYSYISLWRMLAAISLLSLMVHQLFELSKSRWSDTFEPKEGTKAYEIMAISPAKPSEDSTDNRLEQKV